MSQGTDIHLYASPIRRLIWIVLSLLLLRATWFYFSNSLHLATFIAAVWLLFALSWVVNLFRIPIATITENKITLLERLRFGRPNFLAVGPGQLTAVDPQPRGRLILELGSMGERVLNLKYLRAADRDRVTEALKRLVSPRCKNGGTQKSHFPGNQKPLRPEEKRKPGSPAALGS